MAASNRLLRPLSLLVFLLKNLQLISAITTNVTCPIQFPYAYYNGFYCCMYNKEKAGYDHRGAYDDGLCDGSTITVDSECCLDNAFIPCPGGICESLSYETYPCPESHPFAYYNGQYCCQVGFEKASFTSRSGSGCNGSSITRESLCCQDDRHTECPHKPCATMDWWSLTWMAEANEDPDDADYTRRLRVPSVPGYGVTLGRGYDMKFVFTSDIYGDLVNIGVNESIADVISNAAQLQGDDARQFLENNSLTNFTITRRQEWELFKILRDSKIMAAKMILADNSTFDGVDFDVLDSPVKGLVLDLFYRMEYFTNYASLQPEVEKNNASALTSLISDRSKWTNVNDDRFNRRKVHIEKATS